MSKSTSGAAPKKRGFAAMTLEQRREIAAMGGKKAHELGRAHQFNSTTGSAAGKKGGRNRIKLEG